MQHNVKSRVPHMRLYAAWRSGGDDALRSLLTAEKVALR
jgi:hypothetical protein